MYLCEICKHGWCRWCTRGICDCFEEAPVNPTIGQFYNAPVAFLPDDKTRGRMPEEFLMNMKLLFKHKPKKNKENGRWIKKNISLF